MYENVEKGRKRSKKNRKRSRNVEKSLKKSDCPAPFLNQFCLKNLNKNCASTLPPSFHIFHNFLANTENFFYEWKKNFDVIPHHDGFHQHPSGIRDVVRLSS